MSCETNCEEIQSGDSSPVYRRQGKIEKGIEEDETVAERKKAKGTERKREAR